ncbi:MAG: signal recognition particle-docking protein FtsY [Betaproteobacteria bacterium]|nr:signal recognition particle-docking protein FtsY [Betaproteobacteria bacterium]
MFGLLKKSSEEMPARPWAERLRAGLARTREVLGTDIGALFKRRTVDEALFTELETALITADCGVEATAGLIAALRARARAEHPADGEALKRMLKDELLALLEPLQRTLEPARARPFVIMFAGVNGSGKTTSIGKLAKYFRLQGRSVLLAAGDTFRAAAREQLVAWGERNGVAVVSQQSGDPGAVVYDAVSAARARSIDVVLADTAGRLSTQLHLMEEIKKVKRVIAKLDPDAPHEVVLVLDANIGQNALNQVRTFDAALGLTGLVLTKLDGTAKGGVVVAIAKLRPGLARSSRDPPRALSLLFVGVGEGIDDLRPFSAREFVDALLE